MKRSLQIRRVYYVDFSQTTEERFVRFSNGPIACCQ
jgi:hypothetical protein